MAGAPGTPDHPRERGSWVPERDLLQPRQEERNGDRHLSPALCSRNRRGPGGPSWEPLRVENQFPWLSLRRYFWKAAIQATKADVTFV